jgi:hypothetical protein
VARKSSQVNVTRSATLEPSAGLSSSTAFDSLRKANASSNTVASNLPQRFGVTHGRTNQ